MPHTPGPWTMRKSQHDERHFAIHAASAMRFVAHVATENNEANACLIAAAPDLLKAVELILSEFPRHRDGMDGPLPVGIKYARIAFDKATKP